MNFSCRRRTSLHLGTCIHLSGWNVIHHGIPCLATACRCFTCFSSGPSSTDSCKALGALSMSSRRPIISSPSSRNDHRRGDEDRDPLSSSISRPNPRINVRRRGYQALPRMAVVSRRMTASSGVSVLGHRNGNANIERFGSP